MPSAMILVNSLTAALTRRYAPGEGVLRSFGLRHRLAFLMDLIETSGLSLGLMYASRQECLLHPQESCFDVSRNS